MSIYYGNSHDRGVEFVGKFDTYDEARKRMRDLVDGTLEGYHEDGLLDDDETGYVDDNDYSCSVALYEDEPSDEQYFIFDTDSDKKQIWGAS